MKFKTNLYKLKEGREMKASVQVISSEHVHSIASSDEDGDELFGGEDGGGEATFFRGGPSEL